MPVVGPGWKTYLLRLDLDLCGCVLCVGQPIHLNQLPYTQKKSPTLFFKCCLKSELMAPLCIC